MLELTKEFLDDLRVKVEEGRDVEIAQSLGDLHAKDVADIFDALKRDEILYLYRLLDSEAKSEVIAELEATTRGAYCGSLFILGGDDWLQSSIAIRTLEVTGDTVHCWGGGGITASSQWEAEYQETLDKVGPIMAALEEANQCSGNSIPS